MTSKWPEIDLKDDLKQTSKMTSNRPQIDLKNDLKMSSKRPYFTIFELIDEHVRLFGTLD